MKEDEGVIKIDKEFLHQVTKAITALTARMDKYERDVKSEQMLGFVLNCRQNYLGEKDLEKEKLFREELQKLMIRFKIIEIKANLIKQF